MLITRKEEYKKGQWMAWISTDGLNTEIFEFDHEPTEEEAEEIIASRDIRLEEEE
jgi:hypothetical protein